MPAADPAGRRSAASGTRFQESSYKSPFPPEIFCASESACGLTQEHGHAKFAWSGWEKPELGFAIMLQSLGQDVRDCYRRAEDCAEKARDAATPQLRSDFLRLEKSWLMLARSYEFTSRLSAFNNEARRDRLADIAPPLLPSLQIE